MNPTQTKANKNETVQLVSRRGFLGGVFSAGAVILGVRMLPHGTAVAAPDDTVDSAPWHPSVYVGLEPDGRVIICVHRSEMGTGIRTALPMVLADELDVDWKKVTIQQAIGDKKYGNQNTDGSNSIKGFFEPMRQAGATARVMLIGAAASKWGVPASECKTVNHEVVHTSGKKFGYGELVSTAATQPVPKREDLKFKPAGDYKFIGKNVPITDLDKIVSGHSNFGMDAKVPGMVYASIERSPVFSGTLKNVDDSDALKVKGVSSTVTMDAFKPPYMFQALGGVAVIADSTWAAFQGRKKLKIDWDGGSHASFDSINYKKELQATAKKPGKVDRQVGDVDAAFAKTAPAQIHEAEYWVPHLAHAPMEPPVAVADFKNGKVTVWAPTQNPQAVQDTVAAAVGLKPEDVTCNVTLLGGGFGRKSKPDYCAEAAILSKKLGKPVKVVWTREDDIYFDFFHFAAAMYMKAAVDEKGRPTAWFGRSVYPPMTQRTAVPDYGGLGTMGWIDLPFEIPNFKVENGQALGHVRVGWLRSVANIPHGFAVHSFVDELAAAAKRDRVDYLLELLGPGHIVQLRPPNPQRPDPYPLNTARTRRVLETVAKQSNWANKKSGNGHGFGVAVHWSFTSYVASVVEVEVDSKGNVRIPRIDTVVDAGMVVHPDRVKAQFEGAATFGTSLAMMGEITGGDGRVQQSNFHNYPVARINEAPVQTNVTILDSTEPPAGVGEPGVPVIAPAICNAIFAATGKRIRELPIKKQLA